jgi:CubicO group peptidase (beta-lactamase class C family)
MRFRRDFIIGGAAAAIIALRQSISGQSSSPANVTATGSKPSDWEAASPKSQDMSASAVVAALESGEKIAALRSVVVVRNGFLVAERYYAGAVISDLRAVNSATKSISSMLVGLALKRKTIASLGETVSRLIPDAVAKVPDSPAANVTLEQILTGRSGLEFPWTRYREIIDAPDPVEFILSLPPGTPAKSGWTYNDAMVSLLSPILAQAEGIELSALATRDLFVPLGIEQFTWVRDQKGNAIPNAGLALRTRDLAKVAWVMLNQGMWRHVKVLPREWTVESIKRRGPADWQVPPVTNIGYGYLWFSGTLHGHGVAWGWGYGGQFALLVPSLKLAIATAAISPQPQEVFGQTNAVMALAGRLVQAAA